MTKAATSGRTEKGQFGPGNPGRPVGARHKATVAVEALLDGDAAAITRKAIALAKRGDSTALRLCFERIMPVRRGRPMSLPDMPKITSVSDVPGVVAYVMQAVADGDITADEANDLTAIVDRYVRAAALTEHEARIAALESQRGAR